MKRSFKDIMKILKTYDTELIILYLQSTDERSIDLMDDSQLCKDFEAFLY